MEKLLLYCWGAQNEPILLDSLKRLGYEVITYSRPMKDYSIDARLMAELFQILNREKIGKIVSFNYFPVLTEVCRITKGHYYAWVYDMPHYTLFYENAKDTVNSIYTFDRNQSEYLQSLGYTNVLHLPLATSTAFFQNASESYQKFPEQYDITFVGNFYQDAEEKIQRLCSLQPQISNHIDRLVQMKLFQYSEESIIESISEDAAEAICKCLNLELTGQYNASNRVLAADFLNRYITMKERELAINSLAKNHRISVFTSQPSKKMGDVEVFPYVNYLTQMPCIFHNSKINLNISLRSIESGIPLRALDIMACGGFLLSNYQPELAEHFADGEELVLFYDEEDLLYKTAYYLNHEKERQEIAQRGWLKVNNQFSYQDILKSLFSEEGKI